MTFPKFEGYMYAGFCSRPCCNCGNDDIEWLSHSCECDPTVSDDIDRENVTLFKEFLTLPKTPPTSFDPRNCFFFLLDLPGSDIVERFSSWSS